MSGFDQYGRPVGRNYGNRNVGHHYQEPAREKEPLFFTGTGIRLTRLEDIVEVLNAGGIIMNENSIKYDPNDIANYFGLYVDDKGFAYIEDPYAQRYEEHGRSRSPLLSRGRQEPIRERSSTGSFFKPKNGNRSGGFIGKSRSSVNGTKTTLGSGNRKRYTSPLENKNDYYDEVEEVYEEPTPIIEEPKKPIVLKPLPGSEFKPLVCKGLDVVREEMGEYYQYKIVKTGEYKVMEFSEKDIIFDIGDGVADTMYEHVVENMLHLTSAEKILKYLNLLKGKDIVVSEVMFIHTSLVDKNFNNQVFKDLANIDTLDDVKNVTRKIMANINNLELFEVLDRMITNMINESLTMRLRFFKKLESFDEDYESLMKYIEEKIDNVTYVNSIQLALNDVAKDIKNNLSILMDTKSTDDDAEYSIFQHCMNKRVCYISDSETNRLFKNLDDDIYNITKESHPKLYSILNIVIKDNQHITFVTEDSTIKCYKNFMNGFSAKVIGRV